MSNGGFQEARSEFQGLGASSFIGQVRRFGAHGPAYEVLDVMRNGDVAIGVVESGERLDYPMDAFLADPVAQTVP